MTSPAPTSQPARKVWTLPILLNVAAAIGLMAALIGDGMWDMVSWLTLGVLMAPPVRAMVRRGRRRPPERTETNA